jgi:uncharacterized membrane protein YcaP (DUF421 family)
MFLSPWHDLARIVLVGVATYAGMIVLLRGSGKRTLAKMNAFDFIVTIALGSILAGTLLDASVSWAEGMTALLVLVGMQYLITHASTRWPALRRVITSDPVLLVHHGRLLQRAMRRERVTEEEVQHALRDAGLSELAQVRLMVLETDGRFSVVAEDGG